MCPPIPLKPMFFRIGCWLVPAVLLAIEGGVQIWRHAELTPSEAPVFNWRGAELVSKADGSFGQALDMYRADRGAETLVKLDEGRSLKIFYFEWDVMETGPFADVGSHDAEVCNVAAGFKLIRTGHLNTYQPKGYEPLDFRCTVLAQPTGEIVYVFKLPWIQGVGAWQVGSSRDRTLRLKRSFIRHQGQARVLEAGVYGAASEEEAWDLVVNEILEKLEWAEGT
jgi:hypothetical protein